MLRVDLGRLGREGSVLVETSVPAEDPLWVDSGIEWNGPVDVRLRCSYAGTGEIVVRGTVKGELRQQCRRCLKPLTGTFDQDLTLVFVSDGTEAESEDAGAYAFDPTGGELDMGNAVREEVILAINPYVVCDPECAGLCPRCGADLNEAPCDCAESESDPRWDALRKLKGR